MGCTMRDVITLAYIFIVKKLSELNFEIVFWTMAAIFVATFCLAVLIDKGIYQNKFRYKRAKKFLIKKQFVTTVNEKSFFRGCLFGLSREFKSEWANARKKGTDFEKLVDRIPCEIKQVRRPQTLYNVVFAVCAVGVFFLAGVTFDFQIALFAGAVCTVVWTIGLIALSIYEKILFVENARFAEKFVALIKDRLMLDEPMAKSVTLNNSIAIQKIQAKNIQTMRQEIRDKEISREVDMAIKRMKEDDEGKDILINTLLEKPIVNEKFCENIELTSNLMGFESVDELIDSVNIFIKGKGDKDLAKMMLAAIENIAKTGYSNAGTGLKLQLSAQSLKKYVS